MDTLIISKDSLEKILLSVNSILSAYHADHPLRIGMPREELKSKLNLSLPIFNTLIPELIRMGRITLSSPENHLEKQPVSARIALPGHTVHFTPPQQKKVDILLLQFKSAPYSPPSIKECITVVGEEIFMALIESREIILVSGEVAFRKIDYDFMVGTITKALMENGQVSLAEVRDMFQTSRRYVQALLEHLDAVGITVRDGDFRKIKKYS
jgi:selenocysteine-specific elongation factor